MIMVLFPPKLLSANNSVVRLLEVTVVELLAVVELLVVVELLAVAYMVPIEEPIVPIPRTADSTVTSNMIAVCPWCEELTMDNILILDSKF